MRAVEAIMECLKAEGVDVVFGLPGGANLPTYDAFVDAGIRHVLVRHEAGVDERVVGRQVGSAGKAEYDIDTLCFQALHDGVNRAHITTLSLIHI